MRNSSLVKSQLLKIVFEREAAVCCGGEMKVVEEKMCGVCERERERERKKEDECDQIGRFLKLFANNFLTKVA